MTAPRGAITWAMISTRHDRADAEAFLNTLVVRHTEVATEAGNGTPPVLAPGGWQ